MNPLLSELAEQLGLELQGEDLRIKGCNTLDQAGPEEISFLANTSYTRQLESTRAGAVILYPEYRHLHPNCLITPNPYRDFARVMRIFAQRQQEKAGVSELAYIHPQAEIGENVSIHPFVSIGARTIIASGTVIHSGCTLEQDCQVGRDSRIYPGVTLMPRTEVGERVVLHSGVVLGSDGFGFAQGETGMEKVPQLGRVIVEDDVEIGANCSVDRGTLGETRIGEGTKIDNQVQIGHNVQVGRNCILVSQVGIAGSSSLGDEVVLAGQVGVGGHIEIGSGSRVGAKAGVNRSVKPNSQVSGYPAMDHRSFLRFASLQSKLPEIYNRLKRLEAEHEQLREETGSKENRHGPRE